jgi:predicted protein tyrosine phosphatase
LLFAAHRGFGFRMSRLLISSYAQIADTIRRHRPSHMLTLMDEPVATPSEIPPGRHHRIRVHDIAEPAEGAIAPTVDHIEGLLTFARTWTREAPFLVHCWAGISRSTAAAFIVLCDIRGPGHEAQIARELRELAPHAQPNRLMIRHADEFLGRAGLMIAAVEGMGEAKIVWETEVVEMRLLAEELDA